MFSGQMDELTRDPQIAHWMNLLFIAGVILFLVVFLADMALFFRWALSLYYGRVARDQYSHAVINAEAPETTEVPQYVGASEGGVGVADSPEMETETPPTEEEETAPPDSLPPYPPIYTRNTPPFRPVDAFLGGQFIFIATNVVAFLPLIPIGIIAGFRHVGDPAGLMKDPLLQFGLALTIVLSPYFQNAITVATVAYYTRRYHVPFRRIGLEKPTGKQILLGLGLGLGMFLLATGAESVLTGLLSHLISPATTEKLGKLSDAIGAEAIFKELHSFGMRLALFLGAAIAAPIGEEIFFRGFFYNALKTRYSVRVGIVVSALFFALVHISPLALLIIFPMGMFLAYVYEKTHSLWVTMTMHAVNNSIALALLWMSLHK